MDLNAQSGAAGIRRAELSVRPRSFPKLHLHRYFPAAAFYFFLNAAGLPKGLFFTTVLAPFFYLWLYLHGHRRLTLKFLTAYSPFLVAHLLHGVGSLSYYLRSLLLLWTVFISAYAICWWLSQSKTLGRLFDELIVCNFIAALLGIVALPTPLRPLFWRDDTDTLAGNSHLLRLNLLSVEPSAYAFLMLPLLVFVALRLLRKPSLRNLLYLLMIALPFLLSQSFGGISMSLAAIAASLVVTYPRVLKRGSSLVVLAACVLFTAALLGTHNPISQRILQVVSGGDSSTQSRTVFSFVAAYFIASSKSLWWGAGLGQVKLFDFSNLGIGFDISVIPNAIAGVFAELGIVGVLVKLLAEGWLFFKTRVYKDSFRLACFIVGFIAQLTGGYLMNVQEYILWFLAFYPGLVGDTSDADARSLRQHRHEVSS
jgi:hypothetical protein